MNTNLNKTTKDFYERSGFPSSDAKKMAEVFEFCYRHLQSLEESRGMLDNAQEVERGEIA